MNPETATREELTAAFPGAIKTNGKRTLFEGRACGRCGGSGRYSWCATHGDRCFGCGGTGAVLTKRGDAAAKYFKALCSKRIEDLQVGDIIYETGFTNGGCSFWAWWDILEIRSEPQEGDPRVQHSTNDPNFCTREGSHYCFDRVIVRKRRNKNGDGETVTSYVHGGKVIRVAQSDEEKQAKILQALRFQATLTKAGTIAKKYATA